MSDIERLEAEYRKLATKVIYASFEGLASEADRLRLEELGAELRRRNALGSAQRVREIAA